MNGSSTPCKNRQSSRICIVGLVAISKVGTTSRNSAPTISTRRPMRSEIAPANGATSATAISGAVTASPAPAACMSKLAANAGSTACGV